MRGMAKLMQVVHKVQQRLNSDLSIAGVLITQYDGRKNLNKSVSELVQETFQGKVFSTDVYKRQSLSIVLITLSTSFKEALFPDLSKKEIR